MEHKCHTQKPGTCALTLAAYALYPAAYAPSTSTFLDQVRLAFRVPENTYTTKPLPNIINLDFYPLAEIMTTSMQNPKCRLYAENTPSAVVYYLWAYPETRAPKTTVYLETIIPAVVAYVLGPTWKTEIGSGTMLGMPTTRWTDADEELLALRILRAGGAVVNLSDARENLEMMEVVAHVEWTKAQKQQKYLFGWPESGGVWVLGLPEWAERDPFKWSPKQTGALTRHYTGLLDCSPLKEFESIEEFCLALKELGAQYYDNADVSDEVREFGLLKGRSNFA